MMSRMWPVCGSEDADDGNTISNRNPAVALCAGAGAAWAARCPISAAAPIAPATPTAATTLLRWLLRFDELMQFASGLEWAVTRAQSFTRRQCSAVTRITRARLRPSNTRASRRGGGELPRSVKYGLNEWYGSLGCGDGIIARVNNGLRFVYKSLEAVRRARA